MIQKCIVLTIGIILCCPLFAADLPPSPTSPTTKVNVYINTTVKYGFRAPENWFMYLKSNDSFPMPNPPHGLNAILSPYPLDGNVQPPVVPLFMMSFQYVNTDNKSLAQIMNQIYAQASKDNFIEEPHLEKIGEQEWAVATYKVDRIGKIVFETSYITTHQDVILEIISATPEEYYDTIRNLVKESVKTTKFGDVQTLMRDLNTSSD